MNKETQQSVGNTGSHGGGVFAWGGKACENAQIAAKRTLCQRKTGSEPRKRLANLWNREKITKKAHAGHGLETIWECQIKPVKRELIWGCLQKGVFAGIILTLAAAQFACAQTRTLRIVAYNIEADTTVDNEQPTFTIIVETPGPPLPGLVAPPTNSTDVQAGGVLEGIGEETVGRDPAQAIDILALEETTSNPATVAPIDNALNTFYNSPGMYTNSSYQATESDGDPGDGNGPNALIYNTKTVQLLASTPVDPPGGTANLGATSGEYREVVCYEFAPAGVAPAASNEFYIYVSHYKASTGASNAAKRLGEAQIIRNNESTNLPATARVLYVGDYNPDDNSSEPGYQTILSNTAPDGIEQGKGIDPLNITGNPNINWSSSTTDTNTLFMLTEEDYDLEYRDDLQVMTTNVYYGAPGGLQYVPGTFHAFANNASMAYGQSVGAGSDTALNNDLVTNGPVFISASQLYIDLTGASDHLPVVADYTIPLPALGISGLSLAGTNFAFSVANSITGGVFTVWMTTNLSLPLTNWTALATNIVGTTENFTITNNVNPFAPGQFYLLQER